jgi:site-specific recombinase XerD
MDNLQLRFEFDPNRRAVGDTKPAPLVIEVRLMGTSKRVRIPTGIKLLKSQVSDKAGFTCKNHHVAAAITAKAWRIFRAVEAFTLSDKCQRLEDVRSWNKTEEETVSVLAFMEAELWRMDPSMAVIQHHRSLMRRMADFGCFKTFKDVTYENVADFDNYIRQFCQSQPTIHRRHAMFRRFIRIAIHHGLCKYDPYVDFVIRKGKSRTPVFLMEEEVERIRHWQPINERLSHVRDCFLFQCLTGMAYADMRKFCRQDIEIMDGDKVIRSNRKKTDESFVSYFLPEAEAIAERYDYELPVISNQKYNDYLKVIAAACDINKNITTHTGRHTYATYLINREVSIETVARAMGHSNIRITQGYARMLGRTVVREMKAKVGKREERNYPEFPDR